MSLHVAAEFEFEHAFWPVETQVGQAGFCPKCNRVLEPKEGDGGGRHGQVRAIQDVYRDFVHAVGNGDFRSGEPGPTLYQAISKRSISRGSCVLIHCDYYKFPDGWAHHE